MKYLIVMLLVADALDFSIKSPNDFYECVFFGMLTNWIELTAFSVSDSSNIDDPYEIELMDNKFPNQSKKSEIFSLLQLNSSFVQVVFGECLNGWDSKT